MNKSILATLMVASLLTGCQSTSQVHQKVDTSASDLLTNNAMLNKSGNACNFLGVNLGKTSQSEWNKYLKTNGFVRDKDNKKDAKTGSSIFYKMSDDASSGITMSTIIQLDEPTGTPTLVRYFWFYTESENQKHVNNFINREVEATFSRKLKYSSPSLPYRLLKRSEFKEEYITNVNANGSAHHGISECVDLLYTNVFHDIEILGKKGSLTTLDLQLDSYDEFVKLNSENQMNSLKSMTK